MAEQQVEVLKVIANTECPYCGTEKRVQTKGDPKGLVHKIVTCANPKCKEQFVTMCQTTVQVMVAKADKERGRKTTPKKKVAPKRRSAPRKK